jgi:hypothetical protein
VQTQDSVASRTRLSFFVSRPCSLRRFPGTLLQNYRCRDDNRREPKTSNIILVLLCPRTHSTQLTKKQRKMTAFPEHGTWGKNQGAHMRAWAGQTLYPGHPRLGPRPSTGDNGEGYDHHGEAEEDVMYWQPAVLWPPLTSVKAPSWYQCSWRSFDGEDRDMVY